jgi:SAM-dependent methyltransferase
MGKFQGVVQAFPNVWGGLVLDIGCRHGNLRHALPKEAERYYGLDLYPPSDIISTLEADLPFVNASFDTVVALDVLEHVDDIHKAFKELCRVARKYVILILPNAYEVKSRIKFLLGQKLSGKYGLPLIPPEDRHRWLFSFREARAFTDAMGAQYQFEVIAEGSLVGPQRGSAWSRRMVCLFPNLFSPCYIALLRRKEA